MKEYSFRELGFFGEQTLQKIKEKMDGTTYMNFSVSWSNCAGNCNLIVATDYDAPEQEIKNFFLNCALNRLCR